jgi:hypothetical protein
VKQCTRCGLHKPLEDFNRDRTTRDGRSPWCGVCERECARSYYEANRERLLAADRARYANRTEEQREQDRIKERAYYHRKKVEKKRGRRVKRPKAALREAPITTDPLAILESAALKMEEARDAG